MNIVNTTSPIGLIFDVPAVATAAIVDGLYGVPRHASLNAMIATVSPLRSYSQHGAADIRDTVLCGSSPH